MLDPTQLDYDTSPRLRLIVAASSEGQHAYATLWLNLTDLNDNSPKFSQSKYNSAIWENNAQETYVTQVSRLSLAITLLDILRHCLNLVA